jgi:hypothetical protein
MNKDELISELEKRGGGAHQWIMPTIGTMAGLASIASMAVSLADRKKREERTRQLEAMFPGYEQSAERPIFIKEPAKLSHLNDTEEIMDKAALVSELEKRSGILNFAIPMLAGSAVGSKIEGAFGEPKDLSSPEGRNDAFKKDLGARGLGLLAGIAAGIYLNRNAGKIKSFRLYRP